MWSLGALLFGHLTRNCRCSHCPGINSNYALYSEGFCASDPLHHRPLPARCHPSVPLHLLTHSLTHTQSPNTHFPLFSAPPAPPSSLLPRAFPPTRASYWWTHLATGATLVPLWMNFQKYAHSGKGKAGVEEGGGGGESQIHTTSISRVIPELKQFFMLQSVIYFCTTSSCSVHFYSSTGEIVFKLFFKLLLLFFFSKLWHFLKNTDSR